MGTRSPSAMHDNCLFASVIFASLLAVGCDNHRAKEQSPPSANNGAPKTDIETLQGRVRSLQGELSRLQARVSRYDSVSLDPTEKGYGRIDTRSGFFLVILNSAEPYLDGYRLQLRIGNPVAARYDGFKLTFSWENPAPEQKPGESDEQFQKREEEWLKEQPHEKEVSFTETLYPSSWNTVSVVISPASAEQLKTLGISSMETSQIALRGR